VNILKVLVCARGLLSQGVAAPLGIRLEELKLKMKFTDDQGVHFLDSQLSDLHPRF
jgi:hypothetical protein